MPSCKRTLELGIENLPDYSRNNRRKILDLVGKVYDARILSQVSDQIRHAKTCMRIRNILEDALPGLLQRRLVNPHRLNASW